MSQVPYYNYLVRHGLAVRARIAINGFVLVNGTSPLMNTLSGVANHYLVPGDNRLSVWCLGDMSHPSARLDAEVRDQEQQPLAAACWTERPIDGVDLGPGGWSYEKLFLVSPELPRPIYMDAVRHPVPTEGTPELDAAVLEVHDAFSRGDASLAISLFSLKSDDTHKMINKPWSSPESNEKLIGQMLDKPWNMTPIAKQDLVYTMSCDDRLVHVSRVSGEKVLQGAKQGGEKPSISTDLVFMWWENRWRVIR